MIDYYELLNVKDNFSKEELKKQYHKMCLKYHPDKNKGGDGSEFKEINEAYTILSDDLLKKDYDLQRRFMIFHDIDFTIDELELLSKYYNDFIQSNEYKLCKLLFQSIPEHVRHKFKKTSINKSKDIIVSPKWIDIIHLNEDFNITLLISDDDFNKNQLKQINIQTKWGVCYLFIRCLEQIIYIDNNNIYLIINLIRNS